VIGVVYTVVAHFHLGHFLPYVVSRIVAVGRAAVTLLAVFIALFHR